MGGLDILGSHRNHSRIFEREQFRCRCVQLVRLSAHISLHKTQQLITQGCRFSAISGMAFFIAWLVIIACNWRFRLALKAQDDDSLYRRFGYRATWWPWLSILAFVMIFFMVICQFVVSVKPIGEPPSASYFFSQYIGVPIFLVM